MIDRLREFAANKLNVPVQKIIVDVEIDEPVGANFASDEVAQPVRASDNPGDDRHLPIRSASTTRRDGRCRSQA
jgi:hypothetical protein